jgi:hypothetical protein
LKQSNSNALSTIELFLINEPSRKAQWVSETLLKMSMISSWKSGTFTTECLQPYMPSGWRGILPTQVESK